MWILLLGLTSGLIASSWTNTTQEVRLRGCSHVGVFHVQGNSRYSLTFNEAKVLCQKVGATLASPQQLNDAYDKELESCRYGWISDGNITILRHQKNDICAGGQLGVIYYAVTENNKSDAYCYDETDLSDKNCSLAFNLDSIPVEDGFEPTTTENTLSGPASNENIMPSAPDTKENVTEVTLHDDNNHAEDSSDMSSTFEPGFISITTTTTSPVVAENDSLATSSEHEEEDGGKSQSSQSTIVPTFTVVSDSSHAPEDVSSGMGELIPTTTAEPNKEGKPRISVLDTNPGVTIENKTDPSKDEHENVFTENEKIHNDPSGEENTERPGVAIIVLVVLLIVLALLGCLFFVMRKRWCGKSKTLMITKGNTEGNGTAASATSAHAQEREQEMVTLMNKEKIQENGNTEEFTVITLEESPEKNEQA